MTPRLNRRAFLVSASAGAMILAWPALPAPADAAPAGAVPAGAVPISIWATIAPDDTVTVRIARSEMGQGTLTGLAQLVADELDADWDRMRAEYVPPEANLASQHTWGDMLTGGIRGIRTSVDYVRQGAAAARAMLVQARALLGGALAAPFVPRPGRAAGSGRVVVVGGGYGGASCARALRQADPRLDATLVEANTEYLSCSFSNPVVVGLREMNGQRLTLRGLDGIRLVNARATAIDPAAREVRLDDATLLYDRRAGRAVPGCQPGDGGTAAVSRLALGRHGGGDAGRAALTSPAVATLPRACPNQTAPFDRTDAGEHNS